MTVWQRTVFNVQCEGCQKIFCDFEDKGEQESPEAARDYVQTLAQWTRRHGSDWCKDCSIGWTK